jgi:hypothetical protein
VCLILELLPFSLKDMLYPPAAPTEASASMPSSSSAAVQLGASACSATPAAGLTLSISSAEGATQLGGTLKTMPRVDQPADAKAVVTTKELSQHYATANSKAVTDLASPDRLQLPRAQTWLVGHDSSTPSQAWQDCSTYYGANDEATESTKGKEIGIRDSEEEHPEQMLAESGIRPCGNPEQQQQQVPRPSLLRMLQIAADVAAGLDHLHSRPLLTQAHIDNKSGDGGDSTNALAPLVTVEEDQSEAPVAAMSLPSTAAAVVTQSDPGLQTILGSSVASGGLTEQATVSSSGDATGPRIVHRGGRSEVHAKHRVALLA